VVTLPIKCSFALQRGLRKDHSVSFSDVSVQQSGVVRLVFSHPRNLTDGPLACIWSVLSTCSSYVLLALSRAIYSIGQGFWMTFDNGSSDLVKLPLPSYISTFNSRFIVGGSSDCTNSECKGITQYSYSYLAPDFYQINLIS
jgi:hypothetical protein